jgi:hypothetical protein
MSSTEPHAYGGALDGETRAMRGFFLAWPMAALV